MDNARIEELRNELEELSRAMVKLHGERGTVLTVHMENLRDLLSEMDEARAVAA